MAQDQLGSQAQYVVSGANVPLGFGGEREARERRERERDTRLLARPGLHPQHKQRVEVG